MVVLKFGGTSMGDEHTWRRVLDIISGYEAPVVVVSATARTTRELVAAAEKAATDLEGAIEIAGRIKSRHLALIRNFTESFSGKEPEDAFGRCRNIIEDVISDLHQQLEAVYEAHVTDPGKMDAIASTGEQLSSRLLNECGRLYGLNTGWYDAREIIKTDAQFGRAKPIFDLVKKHSEKLARAVRSGSIPILGGYYGENELGELTTLGFEGSDYTASLVGSALDCDFIEIWTDVSGIFSCDPRYIEDARPIPELSFRDATELAYFGAKVLHPSTLEPVADKNIPVYVKNIFEPDHPGTKIFGEAENNGLARAMTFISDVITITVNSTNTLMGYHFLSRVFEILEDSHVAVDVVTTTEASVSVALKKPRNLQALTGELESAGELTVSEGQGIISLVGCSGSRREEVISRVFSTVNGNYISMISYNHDKKNLNLVISDQHLIETAREIHRVLFRD